MIVIPIELCRPNAVLPVYANPGDAGVDLHATETINISPGETVAVPTGLKFAVPEGYEIQIRPRSGLSLKTGLRVANSPGTIDTGYRGEVMIIITNTYSEPFEVVAGMRIAQAVLQQVPRIQWQQVISVATIGQDRGGGLGSTGV